MKIEDVRFKAKIKDSNILVSVIKIDFSEKKVHIGIDKDLWEDNPEDIEFPHFMNDFENVEALLPYTGFKDKNGEPIYEGDILEYPNGGIGLVEYEYGCPTVRKIGEKDIVDYIDCHRLFFVDDYSFEPHTKIIGNCFENPKLLKKV